MALLELILVLSTLLTVAIGVLAYRGSWGWKIGPTALAHRLAGRIGSRSAAGVFLVAGLTVTYVVSLLFGFLAKAMQSSVDHPVFNYVHSRVEKSDDLTKAMVKLTNIGSNTNTQLVCIFAVLGLACAYKRRFYIPTVLILGMFYIERYWQRWLASAVHRGHPPTTLGTYPSGGVGRILAVYGIIIVLIICLYPTMSRKWRVGLWTTLATSAVVEGYSRVYLSLHWFTDALFALPFGALLCVTGIMTVTALNHGETVVPTRIESIEDPAPAHVS